MKQNMRRNRPLTQPLYKPGSETLKKSNSTRDETESDTNIVINSKQNQTNNMMPQVDLRFKSEGNSPRNKASDIDATGAKLGDMSLQDSGRRYKKPDKEIYVPPIVAQARNTSSQDNSASDNDRGSNYHYSNGNDKRFDNQGGRDRYNTNTSNKSKRYSNKRRGNDSKDFRDDWSEKSAPSSRQIRQGSEPRASNSSNNSNNWQRTRDTRSVDPSGPEYSHPHEKPYQKPPSGRRHSTICVNELPPRFRKKLIEEGKLQEQPIRTEEGWDGTSLTFQGHSKQPSYPKNQMSYQHPGSYATLPSGGHASNQNAGPNPGMYATLPTRPNRGRGRLQHHQDLGGGSDYFIGAGYNRQSADRHQSFSRPHTPTHFKSHENVSRNDSRPQTPVNYYRNNDHSRSSGNNSRPQTPVNYPRTEEYNRNSHKRSDNRSQIPVNNYQRRDEYNRNLYYDDSRDRGRHNNDRNRRHDHRPDRRQSEERNYRRNDNFRNDDNKYGDARSYSESRTPPPKKSFRNSLEAQLSPVSPETPSNGTGSLADKPQAPSDDSFFDWSEEVEQNYKLEGELLSDVPTRSSSINSLAEVSSMSMPTTSTSVTKEQSKKPRRRHAKKYKRRSGSGARDNSRNRSYQGRQRQNSHNSTDHGDVFKAPQGEGRHSRRRRQSRDKRDQSYERFNRSRNTSREPSYERTPRTSVSEHENWRDEIRTRKNSEKEITIIRHNPDRSRNNSEVEIEPKKGGIIVLPQPTEGASSSRSNPPVLKDMQQSDRPRFPDVRRIAIQSKQKTLYDPNNPEKPIIIKSPNTSRVSAPGFSENSEEPPPEMCITDQFGNIRPNWYTEQSEEFAMSHYPNLIRDVIRADNELQCIINEGLLLQNWGVVDNLREFLKEALQYFLCKDIKFSQSGNIEQHIWKLLYYNIIELTRKSMPEDPVTKEQFRKFIIYLLDEGTKYFEGVLSSLEDTYHFKLGDFIGKQAGCTKGLGFVGLALISAQKVFIFLGDLARYREQINETTNYGKCRQWYIKAQEINPKNGRPYNQLAVLAVYSRRKLDAVYYYMRSLMSSNPIQSARERLQTLFDEIRKKYEHGERKRREERLERAKLHMKTKESDDSGNAPGSMRKEIWIRPDGGRRVHRTTQALQDQKDSEEEDLANLSSVEVNKRFVISYLHAHGKLITRIGMESFQEAALQMLKEFRVLLQHSPLPIPSNRLLQLLALNMFAIHSTQLKDPQLQELAGYRSEFQERALVLSLQMFNLILERCVTLLQEHLASNPKHVNALSADANALLPPIKIWCDWMLCHSSVWNPPPSTQDFKVGSPGDIWSRLAVLMNLLGQLDLSASESFSNTQQEGFELLQLPEDSVLCGFTPLMVIEDTTYIPKDFDQESAKFIQRLNKLIFFGTVFLCGLEPPVLKLEIEDEFSEYVSVVSSSNSRSSPQTTQELAPNNEVVMESFSEDEDSDVPLYVTEDTSSEVRDLLTRKSELEKRQRSHQLHMERVKKILSQTVVSVHLEVCPKYLVPDTNCFIDHLDRIISIATSQIYTLMVPIVVLGELEGLGRGGKSPTPPPRSSLNPDHVRKVGESARKALDFLKTRHQGVKCVTTKGAVLASTTFTTEDDSTSQCNMNNDDKILATCLILSKGHAKEQQPPEGEPRRLNCEVVLLTDDRNLRVKAYARDVPVRELTDFMKWAGLG